MKPFYNTPTPYAPSKPEKTGMDLVNNLEKQYENFKDDLIGGYCKDDNNSIRNECIRKIKEARLAIKG
jgi:hypothetical protein